MAQLRVFLLLSLTLSLVIGCGGGGSTTTPPPPPATGSLTVTVSSLPSGASASITVTGPNGYSSAVTSTQTLQVAPGAYTVAASKVSSGNSNYWPAKASQSATVAVSTPASITVDYSTIIPKTTKVLDSAGMDSLTMSSDGSTLNLSASSPIATSLQVGDILNSDSTTATPNGLLVRVTSVNTSGQTVTANVAPATLEDAIQQGTLDVSATLIPSAADRLAPQLPQRSSRLHQHSLHGFGKLNAASTASNACPNNPSAYQRAYTVPIATTPNSTITLKGETDFCPSINMHVEIADFKVSSAIAKATLGVHNALGIEGTDHIEFAPDPIDLVTFKGPDLPVEIGPVILHVQPMLTPFIGVKGSMDASAYAGVTTDSSITVGFQYDHGTWTNLSQATNPTPQPDTAVDGNVSIHAYAGIKVGFLLEGTLDPYLSSDAYLQFDAGVSRNPCWGLAAGLEGNVGVTGSVLGQSLNYVSPSLNLYPSTTIAQSKGTCFAPVLNSISPTTAQVGSPDLTIAVAGSNFVPASVVNFNNQPLTTTFIDTADLTAVVPTNSLATDGTFPITVTSPDKPGGASSPANFTVSEVTVTPANAAIPVKASQQFTASVNGKSDVAVRWSVNSIVGGNATLGTITDKGLYTAPATIPTPAAVSITAASQENPNLSGSANVTITTDKYIFVTIDYPGVQGTAANGINNLGEIVGTFGNYAYNDGSFFYSSGIFNIIKYPSAFETVAYGINDNEALVGEQDSNSMPGYQGFMLNGGSFSSIKFPGAEFTIAYGINNNGQIVGYYAEKEGHGFLLSGEVFSPIDYPNAAQTTAYGINNSGQIVGWYLDESGKYHGFIYEGGRFKALDYPGSSGTFAFGINDDQQIVGQYANGGGFLYSDGKFSTIDYPGSSFMFPSGINNKGQIVGEYIDAATSYSHGFLATPVAP